MQSKTDMYVYSRLQRISDSILGHMGNPYVRAVNISHVRDPFTFYT